MVYIVYYMFYGIGYALCLICVVYYVLCLYIVYTALSMLYVRYYVCLCRRH